MKYIITILIASLSIVSAFAQQDSIVEVPSINELQSRTAGDELELANQLYINSEFEKAITAYKAILQGGMESAELYFNMGNAYYKQGMLTDAILNYERAKLLAPTDKDIDFNLSLMNQFVVDKIEPLPRPFFISWWDAIVNLNTANNWGKISVALFILMLACAGFYTFSRSVGMKKIGFTLALILFVGSALTFGMAAQQKSKISHRNHAIILTPTVTVKASPDQSGTPLFVIHEGLKVEVIGELASWIEIQLADGNSGWIKRSDLEVI